MPGVEFDHLCLPQNLMNEDFVNDNTQPTGHIDTTSISGNSVPCWITCVLSAVPRSQYLLGQLHYSQTAGFSVELSQFINR